MRTALLLVLLCAAPARADDADVWAQRATAAHKEAQKTQDPKKYEEAAGYYDKYFARPDAKEGLMAFFYGELLFKLQRYDEAARMYARSITVEPNGPHAAEAAYAYVVSAKNAVHPPDAGVACAGPAACVIPPDQQRLLVAFERYLAIALPADKDRAAMEYRRARLYYDYRHFAEAAPLFDHVLATYPDHELATYSANLEMDCLAELKRYDELRALVERVKKNPVLMKDATTRQQVHDNDAALKKHGK